MSLLLYEVDGEMSALGMILEACAQKDDGQLSCRYAPTMDDARGPSSIVRRRAFGTIVLDPLT